MNQSRRPLNLSFSAKVLVPVILVMVALMAVTLWVVNLRFQLHTDENATRELNAADTRIQHELVKHGDTGRRFFRTLVNEPRYRAGFMSVDDRKSIYNTLTNMVSLEKLWEQNVDFVFYTPAEVKASDSMDSMIYQQKPQVSSRAILAGTALAVRNALDNNPTSDTIRINDKLYNVFSLPIYYPTNPKKDGLVIMGAMTFGEEVGWREAQELSIEARGRIAIIAGNQVIASTQVTNAPAAQLADLFKELNNDQSQETNSMVTTRRVEIGKEHYFYSSGNFPSLKNDKTMGYLLFSSYEGQLNALHKTRAMLLKVSLAAILVSSVIVLYVLRRVTEPLRELRASAEAVGRGDFTHRVRVRSRDEIGELGGVFNQMTGNLQQSRAELEQMVATLKNTQAQLIQSEKLSAIGEFVAGVTHELNNPLAAVMGFSEMLKDADVDVKHRRYLDMIYKSARRCQKIVQSLLSFARRHQPERKVVNLNTLVETVLEIVTYQLRTGNIEVITRLDPNLPLTLADPHQMQQVILNIINNGRQAMEAHRAGGTIKIVTEASDQNVRVIIHDSGPGIPEENLQRIFDPFFTTKEPGKGTGLGLSLCYGIVKEHGGTITPLNRPGEGATFIIELPILHITSDTTEVLNRDETDAANLLEGTGRRVLAIDDEESILEMLREELTARGYQVDVVTDGHTALQRLKEHQYDVIFCDWKMPGLNGRQVYEELRIVSPASCRRVIFITGDVINQQMRDFLEDEQRPCLAKPFALTEVRTTIKDVLAAA
jgi:signal transduction histidine kinase/CheY-like chemotaxis protein